MKTDGTRDAHRGVRLILNALMNARSTDEREEIARIVAAALTPNGGMSLTQMAKASLAVGDEA